MQNSSTTQNNQTACTRFEDLPRLTLPSGLGFRDLLGTGATPEQAAAAIEAATGCRMPAGIIAAGMRDARRGEGCEGLENTRDTLGSLKRSSFPSIEKAPSTLLARLIQNKYMHADRSNEGTSETTQ